MASSLERDPETYAIIGAAMDVHRELGRGFREAIYAEAMGIELGLRKVPFEAEVEFALTYKRQLLRRRYRADLVCYGTVIVELKALHSLEVSDAAQIVNYLKSSGLRRGLLLNFGSANLQYKRFIQTPRTSVTSAPSARSVSKAPEEGLEPPTR